MSVRTVSVRLLADVQGFVANTRRAGAAVNDLARRTEQNALKNKQAWTDIGRGATLAGAGIVAAVGYMVKVNTDFEKQLSAVRAVSNATAADMDKYRQAALKAGKDTAFSAKEAAEAETELAKVGLSTSDILGGALTGSLSLAAAGQLGLADAATLSGQAMKIFGLQGSDVGHIADVLSAGANKSAADVSQLGQALQQGGLVAAQTGLHLEDTVGILSAFADNALQGSDAGTSLKTMLQRLTPQSQQAQAELTKLGISAYDSSGQFVGLANYAQQLQDKMGGLTVQQRNAAMQVIFGSDAVRASNILYKLGAQGVNEYTNAVNDQGAASRTAAIQMDNLAGDIEQLKGSLETLFIQSGSGANDGLRGATEKANNFLGVLIDLPKPLQHAVFDVTALTGATLLMGGIFVSAVPKIAATRAELQAMGLTAARAKGALASLGPAALIAGTALAGIELSGLIADSRVSTVNVDALADSLQNVAAGAKTAGAFGALMSDKGGLFGLRSTDIKSTSDALQAFADRAQNALGTNATERFNRMADFGGESVKQFDSNVQQLDSSMAQLVQSGNTQAAEQLYNQLLGSIQKANAAGANIPIDDIKAKFTQYQAALDGSSAAATDAAGSADTFATTVQDVADSASDAAKKIDDMVQALIDGGMVHLSARDAARQYLDAIAAVDKAVKDNGKTLDIHTKKGRANAATLDDVAKAALQKAQATYDETKATKGEVAAGGAMRGSLLKSRGSLIETARKFGLSESAAKRYADKVLNIPNVKSTKFTTPGLETALTKTESLRQALLRIRDKHVTISTTVNTANKLSQPGLDPSRRAGGGYISGPGTATSDSIPALLSNGEYVVRASAVNRVGVATLDHINRYAAGGYVQRFAGGGQATFTSADFSGITSGIPTAAPTKGDIADLRTRQTKATRALANAEDALDKVRHRKGHTAADVARAERSVANARDGVTAATRKLRTAEAQRASASKPYASRFHTAAAASNAAFTRFFHDIATLRKWGFNALADQLIEQGDEDAMKLAHQSAASAKTARTISRDVTRSAKLQAQLAAAQDKVSAGPSAKDAIEAGIASGKNPTFAQLSASSGYTISDLQAAALSMKSELGGSPKASRLLAALRTSSSYSSVTTSGDTYQITVASTGNPELAGQRAMAGARRVQAVSRGRW